MSPTVLRGISPTSSAFTNRSSTFAGLDLITERSIAELLLEVSEARTLVVALPDPVDALPIARQVHFREGAVAETSGLAA